MTDIANALYGDTQPAASAPASAAPTRTALEVVTDQRTANQLYGATLHRENVGVIREAAADQLLSRAQQEAEVRAMSGILSRHATNGVDGKDLADAIAGGMKNTPSSAQVEAWRSASLTYLRSQYGAEAGEVLAKTQALVRNDPALAARLAGGVGSNPHVMRILAKKAAGR
ncbi:hypothetical protein ACIPRI_14690 [Variovorax sp. LARHSF232]